MKLVSHILLFVVKKVQKEQSAAKSFYINEFQKLKYGVSLSQEAGRCKVDNSCCNQEEPSLNKGYLKKLEANICGKCLIGLRAGFSKRILCYNLVILETAMTPFYSFFKQIRAVLTLLHIKNLL